MSGAATKYLTRTYPVRVEDINGISVAAGQPLELPVDATRRLELRFHLDPVKNPVTKSGNNEAGDSKK